MGWIAKMAEEGDNGAGEKCEVLTAAEDLKKKERNDGCPGWCWQPGEGDNTEEGAAGEGGERCNGSQCEQDGQDEHGKNGNKN